MAPYRNDTHGNVYSHRLSYYLKVRKGGDFFYGKSSNEIDIVTPTQKTVDALSRLEMPAGVYIDIKMKNK